MKGAKVALARRLAVVMHRMWTDGTDFRWSDTSRMTVPTAAKEGRDTSKNPSSADQAEETPGRGARVG